MEYRGILVRSYMMLALGALFAVASCFSFEIGRVAVPVGLAFIFTGGLGLEVTGLLKAQANRIQRLEEALARLTATAPERSSSALLAP